MTTQTEYVKAFDDMLAAANPKGQRWFASEEAWTAAGANYFGVMRDAKLMENGGFDRVIIMPVGIGSVENEFFQHDDTEL